MSIDLEGLGEPLRVLGTRVTRLRLWSQNHISENGAQGHAAMLRQREHGQVRDGGVWG